MRLTTRKIRELEIFQIEGQDEAAANVLEQANELIQEERLSSTRQLLELPDVQMGPPSRPASPPSSQPTDDSVTFTWSSDFSTFQGKPEKYLRSSKAHTNARTPLGVFMEVWDLQIMNLIADETNRYAWQTIAAMTEREETISDNLGRWKETNTEEMYRFFAVLNYMTLCFRSRLEEYWTTGILGMSEFRHIMSRDRFMQILRFLHFVNNDTLTPMGQSRYQNRIAKVGPIIDHCNRKFAELYTPNRELSLDESLLLWKGRLSWAQCIRAKAARFGIKTYELCEAESGYLLRMLLYAGKGSSMFEGPIHGFENTTAKTVVELMDGYLDVGHMLVMDNWYNQLVLTRFLKSRHTDVVGTMARQRKYVPDKIKSAVDRFMERGDQIALHCGDISILTWKDVKLVTLISTYHKADKLSNYFFERTRGRKWYLKVFRRLLNISILNTYTVAGKIDGFSNDEKLTMRRYRYALSEEILKAFPRVQVARPPIIEPRPVPSGKVPVRLEDTNTHFVVHTAKVKGKRIRRRCACCSARGKQKRITTMCKKCNVGLCPGDCWIDYHTLLRLEPKKMPKQ
ncbi:transposase IS4 domain-containing protein [Phthorimaea operculella]|nr:transposase IS4 domain-containing protein [Phthorimaea operculella]